MAHRQEIIEMEGSDDDEVHQPSSTHQRGGTRSDHPDWSLFASPQSLDLNRDRESTSPQSENERDKNPPIQQPTTSSLENKRNVSSRHRLVNLLHDAVPGPSTSRQAHISSPQRRPLVPPNALDPLPESSEDERMRSILGLPPFDPPPIEMLENGLSMEDTFDHGGQASDAPNASTDKPRISEYQCPICFSPPSHACLTACGHAMCAQCLFSSVRAARERHVRLYGRGPGPDGEGKVSRCPVCRAVMKGWDGKGGGVIGLRMEMKGTNERTQIVMPF